MDITTLNSKQLELLQGIMDNHCAMIYDRYLQERSRADEEFMNFIKGDDSLKEISAQYPRVGSAPHEQAFLEVTTQSIERCRDGLRQASAIYRTLGLKTNHLLDRVLGYSTQWHEYALQGV